MIGTLNGLSESSEETTSREEWRDISGYEGVYQVSNLGRIKSVTRKVWNYTKPGRIIKPFIKPNGYATLSLHNGTQIEKHVYVHRVVAQAFIPNERNCGDINHKNFDKTDNRVENLEWVTRQENIKHFRAGHLAAKYDEKKTQTLITKSLQYIMDHKDEVIHLYDSGLSVEQVSQSVGIGKDRVHDILVIFSKL